MTVPIEPGMSEGEKWYERTGHCFACGQPGTYCLCRQPCPCAHRHENGSGLATDPAVLFAVPWPDQDGLFEVEE